MAVIDDILSIEDKKTKKMQSAEVVSEPAVAQPPVQQHDAITSSSTADKGALLKDLYGQGVGFYDALSQTFTKPKVLDDKKVKAGLNLAGLADFATSLGDIISSGMGGNVAKREPSALSAFDNNLINYRRQLDRDNYNYDMLQYRAKLNDIQDRIRMGERLQDIARKNRQDAISAERYKEGIEFRDKQAEESARRFDLSQGNQMKKLDTQQSNLDRNYTLQKNKTEAAQRLALAKHLYQTTKMTGDNVDVDFITSDDTYTLPKKSAKAIIPQLYAIMQEDSADLGEDEKKLIDVKMIFGEGGDQFSKMDAIVRANIDRYPRAQNFLKEYAKSKAAPGKSPSKWDENIVGGEKAKTKEDKWSDKEIK